MYQKKFYIVLFGVQFMQIMASALRKGGMESTWPAMLVTKRISEDPREAFEGFVYRPISSESEYTDRSKVYSLHHTSTYPKRFSN